MILGGLCMRGIMRDSDVHFKCFSKSSHLLKQFLSQNLQN